MTEALFLTRQTKLAKEKNKLNAPSKLYTCALCSNGCQSSKAHAQHRNSQSHTPRVIQDGHLNENKTIVKTLAPHMVNKLSQNKDEFYDASDGSVESDGSDEWKDVDVSDEWDEVEENDNLVSDTDDMVMVMDGVKFVFIQFNKTILILITN